MKKKDPSKRLFNRCEYRGCDKYLKEDYDRWFLHLNGDVRVFCEKHYNIKLVNK